MPKPSNITTAHFVSVMSDMKKPSAPICRLLKAHCNSLGRVSTMSLLAEAARYNSFSPANLHYGGLARRIGKHLAISEPTLKLPTESDAYLSLLGDFIPPGKLTNTQWLLVMKPEFAEALLECGWVK